MLEQTSGQMMVGDCGVMEEIQLSWKTKNATCLPTATTKEKNLRVRFTFTYQPLSNFRAESYRCHT